MADWKWIIIIDILQRSCWHNQDRELKDMCPEIMILDTRFEDELSDETKISTL